MAGYNSLELLVGVPLLAGLFCLALPDRFRDLAKIIAAIVSAAVFAGAVYLFVHRPSSWQFESIVMLACACALLIAGTGALVVLLVRAW